MPKLNIMKKYPKLILSSLIILSLLTSCGIGKKIKDFHEPVDLRNSPLDPDERAKRNIKEGRGISLGSLGKTSTTYEFSTSNPLWRASLEVLDFMPMTTVDYSGGIIISDWYTGDTSDNSSIKISIRFLSNEVRTDSVKVIVHKKKCRQNNNCQISLMNNSKISQELKVAILKKAALFEKELREKK